jgi:hypothetical protein
MKKSFHLSRWWQLAAVAAILAALGGAPSPAVRAQQSGDTHYIDWCQDVVLFQGYPTILYQDFTRYDIAMNWGVHAWDELGIVRFVTVSQDPTLQYSDANLNGIVVGGIYMGNSYGYHHCPTDPHQNVIVFNTTIFDDPDFSDADMRAVGAHETGHAVSIGDHHSQQYEGILMFWGFNFLSPVEGPITPQAHDIEDYCDAWGDYAYIDPGVDICEGQPPPLPTPPPPTPTATPLPPESGDLGHLQIHKRDGDGNALDETCFRVTGPNFSQSEVCDPDDGSNDGESAVWYLAPGTYTVIETRTKPGYVRSPDPQTVTISSGAITEITFINEPVGGLGGELVNVYALKCGQNPGSVNENDVAAGILPIGCALAPGVAFTVTDTNDPMNEVGVGAFITDGSGRYSFRAPDGHSVRIDENEFTVLPYEPVPGTNPRTVTVTANLRVVMVNTGGCTVSPAERQVGSLVTVSCPGFVPNTETVTFYWDSEGTTPVASVHANAGGYATAAFVVPRATFGPHLVIAVGNQTLLDHGGVARVIPRLRLCPGFGKVGDSLKLSLDGFAAHDIVTLRWYAGSTVGGGYEEVWTSPPLSETGDAGHPADPCNSGPAVTLPVPEGVQLIHRVEAVGAANVPHYQNYNVVTSMVLEPGAGSFGTNVTVHLDGFGADCPVTVTWKWGAATTTVATITTNAKGSADPSFVAPDDGHPYDHTVSAQRTGGGSCGSASKNFDVQ